MDSIFCSILAAKEGEPIDGTAPEKDSAIFVPAQKMLWHRVSAKERIRAISNNCDLGRIIASLKNPLIVFYSPNKRTGNHIYVSNSSEITCFSSSGLKIEKEVKYLYAICTDGVKDACCAKFGIPIAKAFSREIKENQQSLSFETSHIGGCRFAATAVCFPSGNSYGRMSPEDVIKIRVSEEDKLIVSKIFRGNVFVSEIHCWIMRHSMENFGYVPTQSQTNVMQVGDRFHISISPDQRPEFKFDLLHHEVELKLYSGCSNIDFGRSTTRSIYDYVNSYA